MKQKILKKLKEESLSIKELMQVKGGDKDPPPPCTVDCDHSLRDGTQQ